jgi:protein ImuB
LGLRVGQPLVHARALVPGLSIVDADLNADDRSLRLLAEWCLKRYSPIVAIDPPQGLWIDISGCSHLYGGEESLAKDLLSHLKKAGIQARLGLADTPGAAYALARHGNKGCMIALPARNKTAIAELPIASFRLSDEIVEGLSQLGFHQIHQLYALNRAPLARRFGAELMLRFDQAVGEAYEPLEPITLSIIPHVQCHFSEPATNPDFIAHALAELVDRLCKKMAESRLAASQIDIVSCRADNKRQSLRIGMAKASRNVPHLLKLLTEKLVKLDLGLGIETLSLSVPLSVSLHAEQVTSVLGTKAKADIASLVDIFSNRLGTDKVYCCENVESDVPERSFRRIRPLNRPADEALSTALSSPSRLLKRPELVEALAMLPDYAPIAFTWRNTKHKIVRADGPERVFGEWWKNDREKEIIRDYFRVEDDRGKRYWLFRYGDGEDGLTGDYKWYLHGFFG